MRDNLDEDLVEVYRSSSTQNSIDDDGVVFNQSRESVQGYIFISYFPLLSIF